MAQVSMTVRMDAGLKASFDALCSQMGMSANKAMNSLAQFFIVTKMMPIEDTTANPRAYLRGLEAFYALRAEARKNELTGMTLDEINEEIRLAREERSQRDAKRQ